MKERRKGPCEGRLDGEQAWPKATNKSGRGICVCSVETNVCLKKLRCLSEGREEKATRGTGHAEL